MNLTNDDKRCQVYSGNAIWNYHEYWKFLINVFINYKINDDIIFTKTLQMLYTFIDTVNTKKIFIYT